MKFYLPAIIACLALGCSQQSAQMDTTDDTLDAQPVGYTVHPAEATGYIDAIDPEAYPLTPGDTSGPVEGW